ncbi:MAG: hypothetical protein M1819_000153 [Sarea resinae]|nr:MAG: hypothetical protein M1819_000153 [Sarea resinae]
MVAIFPGKDDGLGTGEFLEQTPRQDDSESAERLPSGLESRMSEEKAEDEEKTEDLEETIENRSTTSPQPGRGPWPETATAEPLISDSPPNGGYGWVCVACVFLINAHTWGINSSYGVFLNHYLTTDKFPGSTFLDYAFVGGLSISTALFISPLSTSCTRLYGTRTTLLVGVFLEGLALITASWTKQIWQLFLSQGLCFGLGMGFLFSASVGIIPQWFTTKRSLANGIATGGSGIGGMIYSLATNAMIRTIGLGWAFRILGIVALSVNLVCALVIRDRHHQVGSIHMAFDRSLFKRFEFLLFLGYGFFSMLGYIVLIFSLPDYATSIGLSAQQGSIIAALLNLGQGIGRPMVGYFSDASGRINMAAFMTFSCGLFCLVIWDFAKSFGVLIFFAILVGTVAGTFWTTAAPVAAEVVGLQTLPSALSITWVLISFPTTFSEPIGLELRSARGNIYLRCQIFTGFMFVGAALCMLVLRAWKIGEIERLQEDGRERALRDDDAVREHDSDVGNETAQAGARPMTKFWRRMIMLRRV